MIRSLLVQPAACLALLAGSLSVQAQSIPLSSLVLNGSATYSSNIVQLTNTTSQVGSAFVPAPYTLGPNDEFEVFFAYHAYGGHQEPADGLALVIQNIGIGPNYIGLGGSGLGFFTLYPAAAIGVTFDYYLNTITGTTQGAASIATPVGIDLQTVYPSPGIFGGAGSTGVRYVWVQYNNATNNFAVYFSATTTKPLTPILAINPAQDLSSLLGGQFYVGLTAGTGALSALQRIESLAVTTFNK